MYLPVADAQALLAALDGLPAGADETWFIAVTDRFRRHLPALFEGMQRRGRSFFGGVFPGLLDGGQPCEDGAVVHALPLSAPVHLVRGLEAPSPRLNGVSVLAGMRGSALVLIDTRAPGAGRFLNRLYHLFGPGVPCFGGGAGSLAAGRAPCVFTQDGFFADAALVAPLPWRADMRSVHGWAHAAGPLVATRTQGNVVLDLNWDAALDVYRTAVGGVTGEDPAPTGLLERRHALPLGLRRDGAEDVVRDVVGVTPDGGLVCTGDVPQHAVLHVLARPSVPPNVDGDVPDERARWGLIAASATHHAGTNAPPALAELAARAERAGLDDPDGVLMVGEICSRGTRIELQNRTTASSLFYDL